MSMNRVEVRARIPGWRVTVAEVVVSAAALVAKVNRRAAGWMINVAVEFIVRGVIVEVV